LLNFLSKLIREPLIHFAIIGASIYLLYGSYRQQETEEFERTITVAAGEIAWLEEVWEKKWHRPPTPEERAGLINQYVRETVLYREALAMGLEKDDTVIRRRLAQKLEFLSQDLIRPSPPSDEALHAYFDANIDRYRSPDLITMSQIFLDPDKRGDQTLEDAKTVRIKLEALSQPPSDLRALSDAFMLQTYYPERSEAELAKLFGREFARSVFELEPKRWHGPVLSGYGVHLVYVHEQETVSPPAFSDVEEFVRRDWEDEKRKELNEAFVARLMARYKIVIENETGNEKSGAFKGQSQ
jgi:hypothetical protein